MKLGMLLTPIVALTAAGWLGMEGYYMATGQCPLSGCSEDAAMGAQPATLVTAEGAIGGQPVASGGDACCAPKLPALTALAPGGSMTEAPGAIAPNAPTSPTDSCCPAPMAAIGTTTPTPSDGAIGKTTPAPSDGAIPMHPTTTPSEGVCGPTSPCGPQPCDETKKPAAAAATGLETPSAAMDCGPTDCDDQGGCCSGEAAAVDTQTPTMPATPRN